MVSFRFLFFYDLSARGSEFKGALAVKPRQTTLA
jgi:hypothetical protein